MKKILIILLVTLGFIAGCDNKKEDENNLNNEAYQVFMVPRICLSGENDFEIFDINEKNSNESVTSIIVGQNKFFPNMYYVNYSYKFPIEDINESKENEVRKSQWTELQEMSFSIFNMQTGEEIKTIDVMKILEENYADYQPGDLVSPSPISTTEYDGKLAVVYIVEKKPTKDEAEKGIESNKHNLYIGIEEDFHVLDTKTTVYMNTEVESNEYKFLESTNIMDINGIDGHMAQSTNGYWINTKWENTIAVNVRVSSLPENSTKLYEKFPKIKEMEFEQDSLLTFFLDGMSEEEIIELFLEDGQEINYEGVKMLRNTKDGEDHILTGKEDIDLYYDANEFLVYEYE